MRHRLIVTLMLAIIIFSETYAISQVFIYKAKSENELTSWAKENFVSGFSTYHQDIRNKKILVIVGDNASGTYSQTIMVYTFEAKEWNLCLIRFTHNISVKVKSEDDNILFVTSSGKTVLTLQVNTMQYEYPFED